MINIPEARRRVEAIREMAGDDEAAHSEEDALRRDILRAIVEQEWSDAEILELCHIALSTDEISFARWCA